jgi:hypothetical protein
MLASSSRMISTEDREDMLRVEVYHENEASNSRSSFTQKNVNTPERMDFTLKMDVQLNFIHQLVHFYIQ